MKVLLNNTQLKNNLLRYKNIGFVPTMGSLHKGHESLIRECKKKSNITIVSIFVNPKQFNDKKDFKNYPRNIKKDINILKKLKVDLLYVPSIKEIFPKSSNLLKKINIKDKILCAKYRKGHFEGVLNVMNRLTDLIRPKKIFMGEKDYQQYYLVRKFLKKKFKTKIILCKTIRNSKGFALSSRNKLLKNTQIRKAEMITKIVKQLKKDIKKFPEIKKILDSEKKKLEKEFKIKIQYLELRNKTNLNLTNKIYNSKLFIAYHLGKIRLIDNF